MTEKTKRSGALITGDLHLSRTIWSGRPSLSGDAYFGLEQVAALVESEGVACVVAAGDIFDGPQPSSADVACWVRFVSSMTSLGVAVYFIEGQHDRTTHFFSGSDEGVSGVRKNPPWASLAEGAVHVGSGTSFELLPGLEAFGLDYQPASRLTTCLSRVPVSCRVLLCHQPWQELLPFKAASPFSLAEQVPSHVQWVLTGDRHLHERKYVIREKGNPLLVVSPGATHPRAIDEAFYPKSVWLLDYREESGPVGLSFRSVQLPSRPCLEHVVGSSDFLQQCVRSLRDYVPDRRLPPGLRDPLVRFVIDAPSAEEESALREEARLLTEGMSCHLFFLSAAEAEEEGEEAEQPAQEDDNRLRFGDDVEDVIEEAYAARSEDLCASACELGGRLLFSRSPGELLSSWLTCDTTKRGGEVSDEANKGGEDREEDEENNYQS